MQSGRIAHHDIDLGSYQRGDGQRFTVMARLFETPDTCEFWQAMYSAHHQRLGQFFYVLTVPRRVAADFAAVTALVKGAVLDQVKTFLDVLPASDKTHTSKFVADGWFLV